MGSQNCPLTQFSGSAELIPAPDSDAVRMGVAARMAMAAQCGFRMGVILPECVLIKGPVERGCGRIQVRITQLNIMWLIGTRPSWANEAGPGWPSPRYEPARSVPNLIRYAALTICVR